MSEEEAVTTTESVDVEETPEVVEESTEEETSSEDAEAEQEEQEEPKPDPKARKLAKVSYEARELKRQNAALLRMLEESQKSTSAAVKPPKIEDYDTMDEYLDARDAYRDSSRQKAEPKAEQADDGYNPRDELFERGSEKYADFDDVVGADDIAITPIMATAIFEMDDLDLQSDVAYFLGQNPKETKRIARLPQTRQIAEIGKLELKLSERPVNQKTASKAPPPIKPVSGKKTSTSEIQASDDFETFMKKRNKQLGR